MQALQLLLQDKELLEQEQPEVMRIHALSIVIKNIMTATGVALIGILVQEVIISRIQEVQIQVALEAIVHQQETAIHKVVLVIKNLAQQPVAVIEKLLQAILVQQVIKTVEAVRVEVILHLLEAAVIALALILLLAKAQVAIAVLEEARVEVPVEVLEALVVHQEVVVVVVGNS